MIPEKQFVGKRIKYLLISAAFWLGMIIFFLFRFSGGFERLIINLILLLTFATLFVCLLVSRRVRGSFAQNTSEDYRGVCIMTGISVCILVVFSFFPHYTAPFLLIAFLFARGANVEVAMIMVAGEAVMFSLNRAGGLYELTTYLVLCMAGAILTPLYEKKKNRPMLSFILLFISVLAPTIFSYLPDGKIKPTVVFFGIGVGLITDLLFLLLFDRMSLIVEKREEVELRSIVKADYPLIAEIRAFSPEAYEHAKKVSLLSAKCAAASGLNVAVSAAGGLYYRLGVLAGEPVTENGVKLAQLNCFPAPVIMILHEYYGIEDDISSPESALVNIVDTLVRRFERMRAEVNGNEWNREVLIYQTLNEKLATGMLDKSGLSINQYLKIREFLVRGDDLQ